MITYQNFNKIFNKNTTFTLERFCGDSGLHWHSAVEILYIKSGSLAVNLDGEKAVVSSGDMVVINSSVLHGIEKLSDDLDYYFLMVNDEFMKSQKLYGDGVFITPVIRSFELEKIYLEIVAEYERKGSCFEVLVVSLITLLFVKLNRNYKTTINDEVVSKDKKRQMVRSAISYISERYKEKISVDDIASYLHFSKSYLSHAFKEITGYSIIDYVNLVRCHNAKVLLLDGNTVSEVARECGFLEISYFSRTFKKIIGVLPSSVKN